MSKVKFAVVGCGSIAGKHAEAIKMAEEAELAAVCDADKEQARVFAAKNGTEWVSDYENLLKNKEVDVICICTPSNLHAPMTMQAALAGKHVLVEKPMALSLAEADTIIQRCKDAGVILGVVMQNRFKPDVIKLKKALEGGYFGKLTHGTAVVRWNRNQEYYRNNQWRANPSMGGGVLINQAIHNIDLLQWMMGTVESVYAYTASRLLGLEIEDVAVAVLKFSNGALGVVEAASTIYPENLEESISIFGETGTAVIGGKKADSIKIWQFAKQFPQFDEGPIEGNKGHYPIINDFVKSLQAGKTPVIDGHEGRKSLELVLAIQASARENRAVKLS